MPRIEAVSENSDSAGIGTRSAAAEKSAAEKSAAPSSTGAALAVAKNGTADADDDGDDEMEENRDDCAPVLLELLASSAVDAAAVALALERSKSDDRRNVDVDEDAEEDEAAADEPAKAAASFDAVVDLAIEAASDTVDFTFAESETDTVSVLVAAADVANMLPKRGAAGAEVEDGAAAVKTARDEGPTHGEQISFKNDYRDFFQYDDIVCET